MNKQLAYIYLYVYVYKNRYQDKLSIQRMGTTNYNPQIFSYQSSRWLKHQLQFQNQHNSKLINCVKSEQDDKIALVCWKKNITDFDVRAFGIRALYSTWLPNVLALYTIPEFKGRLIENCGIFQHQCQYKYVLLLENVKYRLPDLGAISYADGLYILWQGIKAISVLSTLFHNFYIQQQAIGVNELGECKFWINSNYLSNTVQSSQVTQQKQINIRQVQNKSSSCCPHETSLRGQQQKSVGKALKHLIQQIQRRVLCRMTKQQQTQYFKIKGKQLASNQNYEKQSAKLQQDYQVDKVQKWVSIMMVEAGVEDSYRIEVGQQQSKKSKLATIGRINSSAQLFDIQSNKDKQIKKASDNYLAITDSHAPKIRNCKIIAQPKTSLRRNTQIHTRNQSTCNHSFIQKANPNKITTTLPFPLASGQTHSSICSSPQDLQHTILQSSQQPQQNPYFNTNRWKGKQKQWSKKIDNTNSELTISTSMKTKETNSCVGGYAGSHSSQSIVGFGKWRKNRFSGEMEWREGELMENGLVNNSKSSIQIKGSYINNSTVHKKQKQKTEQNQVQQNPENKIANKQSTVPALVLDKKSSEYSSRIQYQNTHDNKCVYMNMNRNVNLNTNININGNQCGNRNSYRRGDWRTADGAGLAVREYYAGLVNPNQIL